MQVCALHKPQARLCLLASDNLTAKRCMQRTRKVGRGNLERGVTWNRHLSDILAPRRVQQEQLCGTMLEGLSVNLLTVHCKLLARALSADLTM